MEELRKALQDMICLAGSLNEDDPWFGERRNAEERIKKAKTILEQSLTEETEEGFMNFCDTELADDIYDKDVKRIFTHYKLIKREK